jgi:hypothetical protein
MDCVSNGLGRSWFPVTSLGRWKWLACCAHQRLLFQHIHKFLVYMRGPGSLHYFISPSVSLLSILTPLLLIRWCASQVHFVIFFQRANLIGPLLQKNETMETPQNRMFCCDVYSSSPSDHLYRWKVDNICLSNWHKNEGLWRTCWGTYWEPDRNSLRTLM